MPATQVRLPVGGIVIKGMPAKVLEITAMAGIGPPRQGPA